MRGPEGRQGGGGSSSSVTPHPEEPSDLEELEQFARTFKQRRIKLGFTQVGPGNVCERVCIFAGASLHLSKYVLASLFFLT